MQSDKALFVLDRGSIQQSIGRFDHSKADLEAADKGIDMLDLAHDAKDTIGEYVFSGLERQVPGAALREAADQHARHGELPRAARPRRRAGRGAAARGDAEVHLGRPARGGQPRAGARGPSRRAHVRGERADRRGAPLVRPDAGVHGLPRPRRPGAAAHAAQQLPHAAPQGARGGGARSRPIAAQTGDGRDRVRRGLRARAAQDPAAHPHRPRAHVLRGRHLARTTWPRRTRSRRRASSRG